MTLSGVLLLGGLWCALGVLVLAVASAACRSGVAEDRARVRALAVPPPVAPAPPAARRPVPPLRQLAGAARR